MGQRKETDLTRELKQANRELERRLDQTNRAMWALYKELDDKNAELERSNGELDQFATIAGHDLQEPLRKVEVFSERLRQEHGAALEGTAGDYVERIHAASGRMVRLIGDLLSFARVTSHARPFAATDLNTVVADAVSDLEIRVRKEGGRVDIGDLPTIEADASQMHQLFLNLIGNGLKFHEPHRPPVVTVGVEVGDEGPGQETARIVVADNGVGFDTKYARRIFEPFRRLRGMSGYDGTGMGLAICEKIAVRHGGGIQVDSRPGDGAKFTVTLPVTRARLPKLSARVG